MTGLDRATLMTIREALREEGSGETAVLDRLLEEGEPLTPAEAFRVFVVLIGIEWRRGRWALCGGVPIRALVQAWRTQAAMTEGNSEEEN